MTDRAAELQQQAGAAFQAGDLPAAARACAELIELAPERADIRAFAGQVALNQGDWAEAAGHYEQAVALRPDYPEAHNNLARAYRRAGRLADAVAAAKTAAEQAPDHPGIHLNLGAICQAEGDLDAAAAAYGKAVALDPASAEAMRNLGLVRQAQGDAEAAEKAFRTALALKPDWTVPYSNLALLMLAERRPAEARKYCETLLALQPGNIEALSILSVACNDSGDTAAMEAILDFDRLVRVIPEIETPAGFGSLAEFNQALADHVRAHPTLKVPPEDDPTYHHPQLNITEELLDAAPGPMAAFEQTIRRAMDDYRATTPNSPPHPFLTHWPRDWKLASWAVVLDGQGTLAPHVHLDGYLGGVYYPLLPDVVNPESEDRAGWFELGQPPDDLPHEKPLPTHAIPPQEGLMLLFPSYMYHRTLPFRSDTVRISVAFDMVPVG